MGRAAPAQTKAEVFLRRTIDSLKKSGGSRLPTVAELAPLAGVALATMAKAVRKLKYEGVLAVSHGTGIRLAQPGDGVYPPPTATSVATRGPIWERTATRIARDIRGGTYPAGSELPGVKALVARYGVCIRTLRKALGRLADQGTLRYERKRFMAPALSRPSDGAGLVLFTPGDPRGNLRLLSTRTHEFIRALEDECSRLGVILRTITYNMGTGMLHGGESLHRLLDAGERSAVLGFLLFGVNNSLSTAITRIAQEGRPLSILDEDGSISAWAASQKLPRTRIFIVAGSETAGMHVGRHLLELGHRRVAYISPMHASSWSRMRLAGVQRAFAESGFPSAVTPCTRDSSGDIAPAGTSLPASLDKQFSVLRDIRALEGQIDLIMQREVIRPGLQPLLTAAMQRKDITAWVAANDQVALECLDFLKRHRIAVPGDISVVGFDNCLPAFYQGLTSYAFNEPAVIHAMVEHVLDPRRSDRQHKEREPVEIDGFVVSRRTTARPAASVR